MVPTTRSGRIQAASSKPRCIRAGKAAGETRCRDRADTDLTHNIRQYKYRRIAQNQSEHRIRPRVDEIVPAHKRTMEVRDVAKCDIDHVDKVQHRQCQKGEQQR